MNEPRAYPMLQNGNANIAVPAGESVFTDPKNFGGVNDFALVYQVSCTGLPNVKIQMQQSIDGVNWFTPSISGDIEVSLTDKALKGTHLMPLCVTYVRFKITEQTSLVTDTIVNIWLSLQKKYAGDF